MGHQQDQIISPPSRPVSDSFPALLACLVLSGMSGLIYQIAWVRSLELIFGSTTFAIATVLASFMGGLALGSWWMGANLHRWARFHPLLVYAGLEVLLGAAGLLIPLLLRLQSLVYRGVGGAVPESFLGLSLVRLVLCALTLLLPTALMGATLPVASAFAGRERGAERRVGLLYAVNTLGGVLGCAGAGLLLIPWLGLARTQWVAVLLNLAAGAGAVLIARRDAAGPVTEVRLAAPKEEEPATAATPAAGAVSVERLLVLAYALSGFTAMLYEVAWSRLLVLVLGSSTYAYTIMLATFLLGIGLGSAIGVRLLRALREPVLLAGLCQILIAGSTYLSLLLVQELPFFYARLYDLAQPSAAALLLVQWCLAASLMILPTIGCGAMFAATIGGLDPSGARAPRVVGRAYALNTVGAIAGSVVAGFWLVPALGTRVALLAGVVVNAGVAVALVLPRGVMVASVSDSRPGSVLARGPRLALVSVLALFVVNALVASPPWRPEILSTGMFRYVESYRGQNRDGFMRKAREAHGEILLFEEGLTCTVTVFRTTSLMTLAINGKPDASVPPGLPGRGGSAPQGRGDLATQILLGHIPMLLAPAAGEVLVIGLGSGVSLGSVLTHPVRSVDCVELEDAVVRASRLFDFQSGAPLRDPRVRMVVNDARNQLLVSPRRYDVIVSEPSNPWLVGSSGLFTREFFEVAKTRLKPGGVFCQWVQLYELQRDDFQAILRTFAGVFPGVHLFRVDEDAVLLGSETPLPIDLRRIVARGAPRVLADLARARVRSPEDLLAHYWTGGEDLIRALPDGPINTDDNRLIEFVAPLRLLSRDPARLRAQTRDLLEVFDGRTTGLIGRLAFPADDPARESAFWSRAAIGALDRNDPARALLYADRSLLLVRTAAAAVARGEALGRLGRVALAAASWEAAREEFPHDPGIRLALTLRHLEREEWRGARREAEILARLVPSDVEARVLLARAARGLDDPRAALAALAPLRRSAAEAGMAAERAGGAARRSSPAAGGSVEQPGIDALLGWALAGSGRHAEAIEPLQRHLRARPDDTGARRSLAEALLRSGRAAEAEAVARALDGEAPRKAAERLVEGKAAWDAGDYARARALLEEAYQFAPGDDAVALALARARSRTRGAIEAVDLVETFLAAHPDHPWAVGYLSELLERAGRAREARLLASRYAALTGKRWEPLDDPLRPS